MQAMKQRQADHTCIRPEANLVPVCVVKVKLGLSSRFVVIILDMEFIDDQEDFYPDDDLSLEQEINLLKRKAYENMLSDEEYNRMEKEIREKYLRRKSRD